MAYHHINKYDVENGQFKGEIKPRHAEYEYRGEQCDGAHIERQDVRILHQRKAEGAELVAERLRDVLAELLADSGAKLLHTRCAFPDRPCS